MQTTSRFLWNRNELAGAFGDIGTDLPLIIAYLMASKADPASVLIVFGLMQIFTSFVYRIPMPVQPLKLVAAIAITQKLSPDIIASGALLIGIMMLVMTWSGILEKLQAIIPKFLIRGIQLGLGLKLLVVALTEYILPQFTNDSFILLGVSLFICVFFLRSKQFPAALLLISLGIIYGWINGTVGMNLFANWQIQLPQLITPEIHLMDDALILFVAAQLPLSLGNSIFATEQMIRDYFPNKTITVKQIGNSYGLMNVVSAFMSGFPVCHGSGGMAGHVAFGAKTGTSVIIYGTLYLIAGTFFSHQPQWLFAFLPMIILGVILSVEALSLVLLSKDMIPDKIEFYFVVILGVISAFINHGFFIAFLLTFLIKFIKQEREKRR